MIGRRISRFLILEPLGQGGMGAVWKARDELLGRPVAVKILDESLARSPKARRRFRREAETAARLEHPAIAPVFEAGECDGLAFIVMKLIEGRTLERLVEERLLPIDEALRIVIDVAKALDYAHERGVVHRDVTPRNIMVADDARVYVLDFGLARVHGQHDTSTGALIGTAAYIAPETLCGREADARSDIYGLGVVLYEALTGAVPFVGDRPEVVTYASVHGRPEPPRTLRPEIDGALEAVVMRMMAVDPSQRQASAGALAADLEHRRSARSAASAAAGPHGPAAGGLGAGIAAGRARAYVAILPIAGPGTGEESGERARLLDGLPRAASAGLARMDRLHVVSTGAAPAAGESAAAFARRVGANLLLQAEARFVGTAVRVTLALLDPERGVQIAGGVADGSALAPFELQDRFVAAARRALGDATPESDERPRPRDPAARERFAQALSYLERYDHEASLDGAIALLESLLATEGESAAIHAALARACLYKYWLCPERIWQSRAEAACESARRLEPESPDVLLALGELHTDAGRTADGIAALERALDARPAYYEAEVARARALDARGQVDDARQACTRAAALRPGDARAFHVLGLVLFRHGRYVESLDPWLTVTRLAPDNAGAHRNLGSALFHLDRHEEAIEAFRRSIEIRPNAMAYSNLGAVLFLLGRYEECVSALEQSVALAPANPRAWGNLGSACRHIPGREERTREALERAIGLMRERLDRDPGSGEDWARLAGWHANLGRHEAADHAIRKALALAPDDVHCMVSAAHTFVLLGRRAEAVAWVRRAVQSGYGVDSLRRSPELSALAGDPEYERILAAGPHRAGTSVTSR